MQIKRDKFATSVLVAYTSNLLRLIIFVIGITILKHHNASNQKPIASTF